MLQRSAAVADQFTEDEDLNFWASKEGGTAIMTADYVLQPKKKYESPKLTAISLRPEEAVLGHCKVSSASGPNPVGGCANPGGCTPLGS